MFKSYWFNITENHLNVVNDTSGEISKSENRSAMISQSVKLTINSSIFGYEIVLSIAVIIKKIEWYIFELVIFSTQYFFDKLEKTF